MKDVPVTAIELTELYGEALAFGKMSPEKWLKPKQLIVVQDPETDVLGYCCLETVADGIELNVHLGNEGLRSFLDQIYHEDFDSRPIDVRHCLNLSFSHLAHLEKEDFAQIERLDMNLLLYTKFPKFRNYTIGFLPESIQSSWQARYFTQVLKQLMLIINKMQTHETFDLSGDEVILCTHTPADEWARLKVPMQVFLNQANDARLLYQNDLEAYRINRLPVMNMTFEVTQFYIPTPVKKTRYSRGFYPFVTAAFETSTKQIVFAEITDYTRESMETVLAKFAKTILNELQFKPKYLVSDSETVLEFFQDFCDRTKISAQLVPELETSKAFMGDLINIKDEDELGAITFSPGFEDEIDEVLETARGICQAILQSNLLKNRISPDCRNQFTSIVELLHVVMMSNFKELPDSWTPRHVEEALTKIFPTLLTEEEMKYVPEILYHFIDIVGDAQMLPNYYEIKNRIDDRYNVLGDEESEKKVTAQLLQF